jgi:hypothetical protein
MKRKAKIRVVRITPQLAAQWLAKVSPNHGSFAGLGPLGRKAVAHMVKDMQSDNWHVSSAAIMFNKRGELVDGVRRLEAIIASGTTHSMIVIEGIDDEAVVAGAAQ